MEHDHEKYADKRSVLQISDEDFSEYWLSSFADFINMIVDPFPASIHAASLAATRSVCNLGRRRSG